MRSIILLALFTSLCAAIAQHPNGEWRTPSLVARVNNQQVANPDNEADDEDPVTKTKTPKSRVLVIGEPKEAVDRWFDWDETCTDQTERQEITAAFQDALELAATSSKFLKALRDRLPKQPGSAANKDNVAFVVQEDPAFTQMFYAQDNHIDDVRETFDVLLQKMKSFNGRNGDKNGVRFICDKEGKVKSAKGESFCGTGDTAAQAITTNAGDHGIIESKYSFDHSASIVFCPAFFDRTRFPNMFMIAGVDIPKTLDHVDCKERIMLHEWLHLKFTRDIGPSPDEIGFEKAAKVAGKSSPRKADWANAKKNCDNYAWYALYAYWNNNGDACGQDAWPAGVRKPNKP
ncbi:hypothetical protein PRK78_005353 [Emydomyces testavorans]|uniref:Lysine-specific metallo-endopeptidase domain-containing protein n=1 Tax=Emydomyces testavorans TaxID=2070801 RepID=A0AAF0DLK1_9EURO|nr:hypothetical protein PRK78_005353 [Emydomyces testavorans]